MALKKLFLIRNGNQSPQKHIIKILDLLPLPSQCDPTKALPVITYNYQYHGINKFVPSTTHSESHKIWSRRGKMRRLENTVPETDLVPNRKSKSLLSVDFSSVAYLDRKNQFEGFEVRIMERNQ
ncbi:unnamed protein product [Vicia faba]|uniref:Uncharacterized protein n=1 Tax=Vicia faba TaxID=3906 RepID=A0AAV0ZVC4_VICFA|nr:unnamed protein product [Vicia faba]